MGVNNKDKSAGLLITFDVFKWQSLYFFPNPFVSLLITFDVFK